MAKHTNASEKTMSNKVKISLAACSLAALVTVGSSVAYLTASDFVKNRFSIDTNLNIELTEPGFVSETAKGMVPAQTITKDPTVTNVGSVGLYTAMEVKVPVFSGGVIDTDGKTSTVDEQDLYSFTPNIGWSELGTPTIDNGIRTHTFVYDQVLLHEDSSCLFNDVTLANLAGDIGINEADIDITAFAIQSHGFEDAESAYEAYLKQETSGVQVDSIDA